MVSGCQWFGGKRKEKISGRQNFKGNNETVLHGTVMVNTCHYSLLKLKTCVNKNVYKYIISIK